VLLREFCDVCLIAVGQHLEQQLLLRSEVVEHSRMGDADLLGDVGQGAVRRPFVAEDLDRGLEDLLAFREGRRAHAHWSGRCLPSRPPLHR
jgi:hypothetical protein